MRSPIIYIPILFFLALLGVVAISFLRGASPPEGQSSLLGKPVPPFTRPEFSSGDLKGRVTLINFFASWCPPCEAENDVLMDLKSSHGLVIYGIDYKDNNGSRRDYLARLGNPYTAITPDPDGDLAILWGTQGVPETVIIDAAGIIRYRQAGPLTRADIDSTILPLIREISKVTSSPHTDSSDTHTP